MVLYHTKIIKCGCFVQELLEKVRHAHTVVPKDIFPCKVLIHSYICFIKEKNIYNLMSPFNRDKVAVKTKLQ